MRILDLPGAERCADKQICVKIIMVFPMPVSSTIRPPRRQVCSISRSHAAPWTCQGKTSKSPIFVCSRSWKPNDSHAAACEGGSDETLLMAPCRVQKFSRSVCRLHLLVGLVLAISNSFTALNAKTEINNKKVKTTL